MPAPGVNLTEVEKAELAPQAYDMSARGMSQYRIAQVLELNRATVSSLIKRELRSRQSERSNVVERLVAGHEAVIDEAWSRLGRLGDTSVNVTGCLNAITNALRAIAELTGANAPKQYDIRKQVEMLDMSKLTDEQLELVEEMMRLASVTPEDITG